MPPASVWAWAGPLLITLFGGILRFARLGDPHAVVFDETYYVPDAYSILRHGVELNHASNADKLLLKGSTNLFVPGGDAVSHPPLGKIMIAVGEWLFGLTPFGWRFAAAVVGTAAILMTARIARRMTRSTLLGCAAGLLLALDGLELVLSRTAILDIFAMFWILAAFGMLILDRDAARARLAILTSDGSAGDGTASDGTASDGGPGLGIRWRRVLAGVFLGCACATKWDGIWYIIAFGGLALVWDYGARRAAGAERPLLGTAWDAAWLPVSFGLIPFAAYLASWSGWFAGGQGAYRTWAAQHGNHTPVWSVIDSFYQYQLSTLQSMVGLTTSHAYGSRPWTWLYLGRPVSFYYAGSPPLKGCGSSNCSAEVLAIGTPAIWWASIAALIFCVAWLIARRDWRPGAVLTAVAAGWLPWFWFAWHDHRTEFYFYAVAFLPFLVIAITMALGMIIGPASATPGRRAVGAIIAGAYLLTVLANLAYLYPILTAKPIPYTLWDQRMWFDSWI